MEGSLRRTANSTNKFKNFSDKFLPPIRTQRNTRLNIQRRDKDEIPEKFSDKLINLYLTNSEIVDNIDFIISSNIFRYLIMTSQYKSAEKVRQCLRELKLECDEDNPIPPEKNKNAIIGRREAYRFFSKIIKI